MRSKLLVRYTLPLGSDLTIDTSKFKNIFILGDGTLQTDVSIVPQYIVPDGDVINIHYHCSGINLDGNKIFVFGREITEYADKNLVINCFRYGSQWKIIVTDLSYENLGPTIIDGGVNQTLGQITEQGLMDSSVTTPKIADNAVTIGKMTEEAVNYPVTFLVDFEDSDNNKNLKVWLNHNFIVKRLSYTVIKQPNTDSPLIKVRSGNTQIFDDMTIDRTQLPEETGTMVVSGVYIPTPYTKGFVSVKLESVSTIGKFLITLTILKK